MPDPVFILSTGRTGTQFFQDYLNQTSGALCLHEPWPSRRFKFLSNLYLNGRSGAERVGRIYQRSRKRLFRKLGDSPYIESSNFLFGCMEPLSGVYPGLKVLHLVRHPVSYAGSHLGKGFWKGHKRFFARHVPYWLENLQVQDRRDPVQLLAARWNYVNRQIASHAGELPYLRVRFEDLFGEDAEKASATLNLIREFCGLSPLDREENESWLSQPKNASRRTPTLEPGQQDYISRHCSELMKEYQYA